MRSIAAALFGIALAAGASYAHGKRPQAADQLAGTLACVTRPELSLVFGRSPFATCTFLAERDGFREEYHALLATSDLADQMDVAQKIVWRVWTTDGSAHPAMLRGTFRSVTDGDDQNRTTFAGRSADLEIISHSWRSIGAFAPGHARIELAGIDG